MRKLKQGNEVNLKVTVKDPAGELVPLAGMTAATYQLADSVDSAAPHVTKELGAGITFSGSVITVQLDGADTAGLTNEFYYHEIKITDAQGFGSTVMAELFELEQTLIN